MFNTLYTYHVLSVCVRSPDYLLCVSYVLVLCLVALYSMLIILMSFKSPFSIKLFLFTFCVSRVTAVDGHYQIGIYSVRPIGYGEEITFDYNSVTEVSVMLINYSKLLLINNTVTSFCF